MRSVVRETQTSCFSDWTVFFPAFVSNVASIDLLKEAALQTVFVGDQVEEIVVAKKQEVVPQLTIDGDDDTFTSEPTELAQRQPADDQLTGVEMFASFVFFRDPLLTCL